MDRSSTPTDAHEKLQELIKGIKFAMITARDASSGRLRARPMTTQDMDADGTLWFLTSSRAEKTGEELETREVNVSYVDADAHRYVSVSGTAELSRDRALIERFWNPIYKTWFPQGLDAPDLALLRVTPEEAEYWDPRGGKFVQLVGFIARVVLDRPARDLADHRKLAF